MHLFRIYDIEKGYYADGEDAYDMRKPFTDKCNEAFSSQVANVSKALNVPDKQSIL